MIRDIILKELKFETSLSSGAGGQHVNRTESAVGLRWNPEASAGLNSRERELLVLRLGPKLNKEGELLLRCESERSQLQNKHQVVERFFKLLEKSLFVPKKRFATKPTRSSKERRLTGKKINSLTKNLRRKVGDN